MEVNARTELYARMLFRKLREVGSLPVKKPSKGEGGFCMVGRVTFPWEQHMEKVGRIAEEVGERSSIHKRARHVPHTLSILLRVWRSRFTQT